MGMVKDQSYRVVTNDCILDRREGNKRASFYDRG